MKKSDSTSLPYAVAALPVYLDGWRFRSRTEARWAMFFQSMRIGFEYEPQGFKLRGGICYLPDFYLPWTHTWAEVKGVDPTGDEQIKCEAIAEGFKGSCLYLSGNPDFRLYGGVSFDCGAITFAQYSLDIYAKASFGKAFDRPFYEQQKRFWSDGDAPTAKFCSPEYRQAIFASRSARFDGSDRPPRIGHEPFNLSDRELWEMH